MVEIFILSMIAGTVSGLLAGLFGIGGGLILVPILVFLFKSQDFSADFIMHMAVATSLSTIVLTSISATLAHHRLKSVIWHKVYNLVPGIVIGSVLGAVIADTISADSLRIIFAIFLLYIGGQMAFQIKPEAVVMRQSRLLDAAVAIVIGTLSSLLGIGGGTMTVPYLVRGQYPVRNAVGIASACGLPIAFGGTLSYMLLGYGKTGLPAGSWGYVYLPAFAGIVLLSMITAPVGAKLAHKLPAQTMKSYFSLLIIIMAVKLLSE